MTRPDRFRSASVRLAFTYVTVFCLSVLALGVVTYVTLRGSIEQQLRQHIEADMAQLLGDYEDDGLDELRHDIAERIEASPANRLRYFVSNAEGKVIFDRIEAIPDPGWHILHTKSGSEVLMKSVALRDGYRLAIAADLDRLRDMEAAIRHSFALVLGVTLLLGLIGSWVVSRRFLARLERFNRTAERVGSGALSERMEVSGSGDDFDQLATVINRMLGRIEALVAEVKQVSTHIAHDLRTPLGRIRQRLERLREQQPQAQETIDAIIAELDASLEIFAALLRIAEIESGARKAGFAQVDLSQLLGRLADAYAPVAEEKGITLSADLAPNMTLHGDAALLTQAFANLIENALRHAYARHIRLTLKAHGNGWRASVADDGVGIPAGEHGKLANAFYRLDTSRTTPGNGLGLGMATAIATLHGATLRIEDNTPGLRVSIGAGA